VERFKIGDCVLILPRYAHLYASDSGVIVAGLPDPFRSAFNEYTVEFPDGSTANLFEFQIHVKLLSRILSVRSMLWHSAAQRGRCD